MPRSRSCFRSCRALICCVIPLLTAAAPARAEPPAEPSALHAGQALLTLEYQTVRVPGDQPVDLLGFHAYRQVLDGVYLGAGFYAPLLRGEYGGFVAADLGVHLRHRLAGPVVALAGLSAGGGGGGRNVEHSKQLTGSGGFAKGYLGLGYDLGAVTLAATVSRLKFRNAAIDGTQANLLLEVPFSDLTGPFSRHGQPLSPADDRLAAQAMGESMLTLALDNYRQQSPSGSNKSTVRLAELQYAHFFSADTYWFASFGMGYAGLPLYNQLLGGIGRRMPLTPDVTLYGQLGLGSGGYAPDVIDTRSGLLVYPRLMAELALTRDLGVAVSAGYMAAPRGSSRNQTFGLSLTQHLRGGRSGDDGPAHYQGLRLSVLHQTDFNLRYRDITRPPLHMVGLQLDVPLSPRWYVPLQASGAYDAYLGYPGYAEILGGIGVQTLAAPDERWQGHAQLMAGANVHGRAVKGAAGLRCVLSETLALNAGIGRVQARGATGGRFSAGNLALGLDYRFAIPTR